jgi:hypothetical protein
MKIILNVRPPIRGHNCKVLKEEDFNGITRGDEVARVTATLYRLVGSVFDPQWERASELEFLCPESFSDGDYGILAYVGEKAPLERCEE